MPTALKQLRAADAAESDFNQHLSGLERGDL